MAGWRRSDPVREVALSIRAGQSSEAGLAEQGGQWDWPLQTERDDLSPLAIPRSSKRCATQVVRCAVKYAGTVLS
jgi:hypothetical protein